MFKVMAEGEGSSPMFKVMAGGEGSSPMFKLMAEGEGSSPMFNVDGRDGGVTHAHVDGRGEGRHP